jgi:hypothetical protein
MLLVCAVNHLLSFEWCFLHHVYMSECVLISFSAGLAICCSPAHGESTLPGVAAMCPSRACTLLCGVIRLSELLSVHHCLSILPLAPVPACQSMLIGVAVGFNHLLLPCSRSATDWYYCHVSVACCMRLPSSRSLNPLSCFVLLSLVVSFYFNFLFCIYASAGVPG